MKKTGKIILIIILSIVAIQLVSLLIFRVQSPGKLDPLTDEHRKHIPASISEKRVMEIGGIQQGFFIRGEDTNNPVILYLHGGPGSPELPFILSHEQGERLEKYFTVCYWDQRGAGMSFHNSIDPQSMTVDQIIEDTRELTLYLKQRFGQDKIYLMGHSWGSYLGVKTIQHYPEEYRAYIGIGQVTRQLESEKLAYDYMLGYAAQSKDKKALKNLREYHPQDNDFPDFNYLMKVRTPLMNKFGIGIMRKNFRMSDIVADVLTFNGYTVSEKTRYPKGSLFSYEHLFDDVLADDLFVSSNTFKIPVYVVHGKYDYQVSYALAKEWIGMIDAPEKKLFTFEDSAHSPNMEEPGKFVETMLWIDSIQQILQASEYPTTKVQ